jgi:luciferase-like monooxygenase
MGPGRSIEEQVASWPGVEVRPHRFGGRDFLVGRRELGHIHGDHLADLPFPKRIRDQLINENRAQPHHVLPDSGWVSRKIKGSDDVSDVVELFRLNYDRYMVKAKR